MFFYAIRGATTVDENTPQGILDRTAVLLESVIKRNEIDNKDIVSIIFTATRDLDSQYPAVAAREMGMTEIPLFCCQEMHVEGSLEKCIRLMMHVQLPQPRSIEHVYLEKAQALRPDLIRSESIIDGGQEVLTIAIDGPAGAGKSTIARIISEELDIAYLDTGAMYRTVAYKVLSNNIDSKDSHGVISALASMDIQVRYDGREQRMILDGKDVTSLIRDREVSKAASDVALIPEVRIELVKIQRDIAHANSLVMDGRDIGTYVLPNATLKFYLTASLEERAERRWKEMRGKGIEEDIESIKKSIRERDSNDENRSFAPLKQSKDAILVDTTEKSIGQVTAEILGHIDGYLQKR